MKTKKGKGKGGSHAPPATLITKMTEASEAKMIESEITIKVGGTNGQRSTNAVSAAILKGVDLSGLEKVFIPTSLLTSCQFNNMLLFRFTYS